MDEYKDIDCLSHWDLIKDTGDEETKARVRENYQRKSRDNARTPMQWTAEQHAGFTTGEPWIPVPPNASRINVESQVGVPGSVFEHYRSLVALRHAAVFMNAGSYVARPWSSSATLIFFRSLARMVPSVIGTSYCFPVRLSVIVSVSAIVFVVARG